MNKEYKYKDWELDSYLEVYMCYYLEELQNAGYISEFTHHSTKWDISPKVVRPYLLQLKTKSKQSEYHLLHPSTYTADFSGKFTEKASNIFYLDPSKPVSRKIQDIPFRLSRTDGSLDFHLEIKSVNESTTSSSISFVVFQKVVHLLHGDFINKVQPFTLSKPAYKKTLFYNTFFPKEVINREVYLVDCQWGKKGTSKIKFSTRTLEDYERGVIK